MPSAELPNRSLFKAPEVCEIAKLQPYVLRSWEAEFPDLGVTRAGARVYRRGDVERVLRLKHLLFVEGLTLAGARRRLEEERVPLPDEEELEAPDRSARGGSDRQGEAALRRHLSELRKGLQSLLEILGSRHPAEPRFELRSETVAHGAHEKTSGRTGKKVESDKTKGAKAKGRPGREKRTR